MKLTVKNLEKSFHGTKVLKNISFEVENGKALGLLGRNGAGKTTTIRILMDVMKADSGEIYLDDQPFVRSGFSIGYLPEERGLYPKKTVIEQLVYLGRLKGLSTTKAKENALYWLDKLQISEYEKRLLETLSKGNQQKVQLASTLVSDPKIVILDEPFSGLDPVNAQILKDIVNECIENQKIVIFSSHQMSYVEEFCEDIVIINKGEVALKGNLKEIKKSYGKNQLIISANQVSNQELGNLLSKSSLLQVEYSTKNGVVITMEENTTKKDILNLLMNENIDIELFGDYEPSLNDIFVMKVGE
ncbi:MAG: ABC transporter ATP-binding protein [Beduini sp.]